MVVWGCFTALRPKRVAVVNGGMNSAVYQNILKENILCFVCDLNTKLQSTEMLWYDLKQAAHDQNPSNIAEL